MLGTAESFLIVSAVWLLAEITNIYKAHLLHAIALCSGHHQDCRLVARTTIGSEVNFGLRILVAFRTEEALELRDAADNCAVPHDRAVEVDVDLNDFGAHRRRRVVGL